MYYRYYDASFPHTTHFNIPDAATAADSTADSTAAYAVCFNDVTRDVTLIPLPIAGPIPFTGDSTS